MRTSMYKRRGAVFLTLVLMFTTLFGGLGSLGINGVVDEAYADADSVELKDTRGAHVSYYSTLAEALTAAGNGYTIILSGNVTETAVYTFVTTGKNITIDGQNHTVTGLDGDNSSALVLSGTGTVTLKGVTLQGGTASTSYTGISTGLKLVGGTNVQSIGTVNSVGGTSEGYSYGVWNTSTGTGTVNVTNATGGTVKRSSSCGVRNDGSGTINVVEAKGGNSIFNSPSYGVYNYGTGTVNVTNATGGNSAGNSSFGVQNFGDGVVNVETATGGTAGNNSYGVLNNGDGVVNVETATSYRYAVYITKGKVNAGNIIGPIYDDTVGELNTGIAITTLTLNKGTCAFCVLDSIAIASSGATKVGTLPEVSKDGVLGRWFMTSALATPFTNTVVGSTSNLYSSFYTAVTGITVSGAGAATTIVVDDGTLQMSAVVLPAGATNKTVTWSVEAGTGTASINSAGLLTALTNGTVTVKATANDGSTIVGSKVITLSNQTTAVTGITVSGAGDATTIVVDDGTLQMSVAVLPLAATNKTVTWSAEAGTGAASINSAGLLTALTNGTVTVKATANDGSTIVGSKVITLSNQTTASTGGSGSSTGSGGGGGSAASSIINTNTGDVTDGQLNNAAGAAKNGETVTINSNKNNEVSFPASGLGSLAGKDNSLTVVTEKGTLTFDSKAVSSMGTQAKAEDIQVIVDNVDKTILTDDQQSKVGDKVVYDLTVMSGGNLISSFNGGRVNVSIPYEVKTGQSSDDLTVWYMADDGNLTEIKCTYDEKTKSVTFVVDHFSKYIIGYADGATWVNPFQDLVSGAWFYEAVAYVNSRDLMKGQTETTFAPQAAMTRGMFVTILGRMEGLDTSMYANSNTFSDVDSSQYYSSYIAWASDKSIVSGMGGGKFVPNASVTREQMAVMMTNYMKYKGQGPVGEWAIQLKYGDLEDVSSWAGEGVMFVTMKGLMKGMGNDASGNPLFAPKLTSNRAQTAQLMMNLQELMK